MSTSDAEHGIPSPVRTHPQGRSVTWRRKQLLAAGYDELSAQRLATDELVDIHAMIVLKEQPPLRKDRSHGA